MLMGRLSRYFLTFMYSLRWQEIQHYLCLFPKQKDKDRPDVVARVFQIKLIELMKEIKMECFLAKLLQVNLCSLYRIIFYQRRMLS